MPVMVANLEHPNFEPVDADGVSRLASAHRDGGPQAVEVIGLEEHDRRSRFTVLVQIRFPVVRAETDPCLAGNDFRRSLVLFANFKPEDVAPERDGPAEILRAE
jgi:hypothetical protein